ncbi:tryptophan synthase beta subunit-like PLP-dependent enzyme [Mollisia scopiformis]|uniref:Tryptophan synthase beta subunit-like PLP-dependent enzyme n=1 Tax=Mollisia scopiformis TaxID=149040 RepID=A0A194X7V7_MOLSC|nr:tryptophan synthase beta subunit-like PLP-dependent enzyme [Mollisia scopiformis]KUJ16248.1 tryptophan synthase beta subunit-like PLP-dependent enzyme [Mollisia scopiformis]
MLAEDTSECCTPELFFKLENRQVSGSFKFRGAIHYMSKRSDIELRHGVATYSTGNHALALAHAAGVVSLERGFPIKTTVFIPTSADDWKAQKVKETGATVCRSGTKLLEAYEQTLGFCHATNSHFVSPADHPDIILGQGTITLEFQQQLLRTGQRDMDAIIMPCGGGSLLAGAAIFAKDQGLKVLGSEPISGGPRLSIGRKQGQRVLDPGIHTIADDLRSAVSSSNWDILSRKEYVHEVYGVTEDQIQTAMSLFHQSCDEKIEPSSAVPLAVLLFNSKFREDQISARSSRRIGVILSGGNIKTEK